MRWPNNGGNKMKVYIRNNKTGEVRSIPWEYEVTPDDYLWSEGNYSCDCNRDIFFKQGTDEPENHGCGMNKYWVEIKDENEKVIYSDD